MAVNTEIMKVFGFWSSVLVLKMLAMVILTAFYRFKNKVFLNPEDTKFTKKSKVAFDDPDIERVRRNHRNDLETILPWFIITYIWLTTNPSPWLAGMLIKSFVISRILHTLSYSIFAQQPARVLSFVFGYTIIVYEIFYSLLYYS
ncbi:microsomal glutathione S-transferase 1-like [Polistes fuscatus]|uniref:microsomal glutathione S-transferase 1-like n=1 Tax=Polistes fuscatus TaxID=30207 RepID=UPI001CAA1D39|nr:microsomal glutathione S-transferase 1-like [Polistes fuscatus]XP_043492200.1 microsomal glutathione S-transferase 1-like [Polistes fuscatus]XP_043492201.1 microsomal glutathione S-transferase 1-like [Polistes fuscatus]